MNTSNNAVKAEARNSQVQEQINRLFELSGCMRISDSILSEKLNSVLRPEPIPPQEATQEEKDLVPLAHLLREVGNELSIIYENLEYKRQCIEL